MTALHVKLALVFFPISTSRCMCGYFLRLDTSQADVHKTCNFWRKSIGNVLEMRSIYNVRDRGNMMSIRRERNKSKDDERNGKQKSRREWRWFAYKSLMSLKHLVHFMWLNGDFIMDFIHCLLVVAGVACDFLLLRSGPYHSSHKP